MGWAWPRHGNGGREERAVGPSQELLEVAGSGRGAGRRRWKESVRGGSMEALEAWPHSRAMNAGEASRRGPAWVLGP